MRWGASDYCGYPHPEESGRLTLTQCRLRRPKRQRWQWIFRWQDAAACVAFAVAAPALAHHSFAMFDRSKTISLTGTVRTFSWTNPHTFVWVYIDNGHGGQDIWAIEFASSPVGLARDGWTKDTLKPGDKITIELNPLRDGRTGGMLKRAYLADGRTLDEQIEPPSGAIKDEEASSSDKAPE
jgi:hypothetical protein